MGRAGLAALAGVASISCLSASAAIVDVTYTGLASGFDGGGIFGVPATSYIASPFIAHFRFDELPDPWASVGGILGAEVTINGQQLDLLTLGAYHEFSDSVVPGYARRDTFVRFGSTPLGTAFYSLGFGVASPDTPTERTIGYSTNPTVDTQLTGPWNSFYGEGNERGRGRYYVSFGFDPETLVVTSSPSTPTGCCGVRDQSGIVPEPAAWALLLVGFFATGGILRSQNSARRSKYRAGA